MSKPTRSTSNDFDPDVLDLFDQYVHGVIDRRGFLTGAAKVAGMVGAIGLLSALTPSFAAAQQVKPDDERLLTSRVDFESPDGYGTAHGYLVRPAKARGPLPVVLVVHENRGLNPHIEDVARRFGLEGYIAFAPDALFPLGGYPGDEDKARALFSQLDQTKTREDFVAAASFLRNIKGGNRRLGAVGFCYGGAIVSMLATRLPQLAAGAPFYGSPPPTEDVSSIKAELLVVLAANDDRVNSAWPAYEAALNGARVRYQLYQPAETQHGFHNDTTPRYHEAAAIEAWRLTLALFGRTLRAPAKA